MSVCIVLGPPDEEMCVSVHSQALLELGEVFPAVQCAERAVQLDPQWATARQTLGRAHLAIGELEMVCTIS